MARQTITVTTDWFQVGTGACILTVNRAGKGALMINESATDTDAFISTGSPGDQFNQNESKPTFVRATGEGWVLLADGVI